MQTTLIQPDLSSQEDRIVVSHGDTVSFRDLSDAHAGDMENLKFEYAVGVLAADYASYLVFDRTNFITYE
jgi:hypothetical protein